MEWKQTNKWQQQKCIDRPPNSQLNVAIENQIKRKHRRQRQTRARPRSYFCVIKNTDLINWVSIWDFIQINNELFIRPINLIRFLANARATLAVCLQCSVFSDHRPHARQQPKLYVYLSLRAWHYSSAERANETAEWNWRDGRTSNAINKINET